MLRIYTISLLLLLVGWLESFSQTVALVDTNFRNHLKAHYSELMVGEELDTVLAGAFTGSLSLNNANLYNIDGIEYFNNIWALELNNNHLVSIPALKGFDNLTHFFVNSNALTSLPDFEPSVRLRDFQVMENELTELPAFNKDSLQKIYCSGNHLTEFPDLLAFKSLEYLVIGDNDFSGDFDYAACPNLIELHVHQLSVTNLTGLQALSDLEVLFAWQNEIEDFSGLDDLVKLKTVVIYDNLISELPDLSNKPGLKWLNISECNLTFEDLETIHPGVPDIFEYGAQNKLNFDAITSREKLAVTFQYPEQEPSFMNSYVWSKDGIVIDSSSSSLFRISSLSFSDAGEYQLRVYNSNFPNLIIESSPFQLTVDVCMEFKLEGVEVLSENCTEGYVIDLSGADILGGTDPFQYTLKNDVNEYASSSPVISSLPAGEYVVSLQDVHGCEVEQQFVLSEISGCDPVVSPDGDGVADTYFVETVGEVKVYDLKRQLIRTFNAPMVWDMTDQSGQVIDAGYYILIQEGVAPIHLTVVR